MDLDSASQCRQSGVFGSAGWLTAFAAKKNLETQKVNKPVVIPIHEMVACAERHQMCVISRSGNGDGACATNIPKKMHEKRNEKFTCDTFDRSVAGAHRRSIRCRPRERDSEMDGKCPRK